MKKFLLLIPVAFLMVGCDNGAYAPAEYYGEVYENPEPEVEIIEITDPDFEFQIKEIQLNKEEHLGQTFRYEGLFLTSQWQDETLYFVARLTTGACCGLYGFEVYLNDFPPLAEDTWVEVTGVLEEFYAAGQYFLRINVTALEEREEPSP